MNNGDVIRYTHSASGALYETPEVWVMVIDADNLRAVKLKGRFGGETKGVIGIGDDEYWERCGRGGRCAVPPEDWPDDIAEAVARYCAEVLTQ